MIAGPLQDEQSSEEKYRVAVSKQRSDFSFKVWVTKETAVFPFFFPQESKLTPVRHNSLSGSTLTEINSKIIFGPAMTGVPQQIYTRASDSAEGGYVTSGVTVVRVVRLLLPLRLQDFISSNAP